MNEGPWHIVAAPYLPLTRSVSAGPWTVGPLADVGGRFASCALRERTTTLLSHYADPRGEHLQRPAIAFRDGRIDGAKPDDDELRPLQRALQFATLDQHCEAERRGSRLDGWWLATADNADLFILPLHPSNDGVGVSYGGLVRRQDLGGQLGDPDLLIRAPTELHLPIAPFSLDQDVFEACYLTFAGEAAGDSELARRLGTAVDWLAKATRNTVSIDAYDRVVHIKTAFESLTGASGAIAGAQKLQRIFAGRLDGPLVSHELLWQPEERRPRSYLDTRTRTWKEAELTDLEHWHAQLTATRNLTIHHGERPDIEYREAGSRYAGHYPIVGGRLLREALRVLLEDFGFPHVWRGALARTIWKAFEAQGGAET
jgi:hypothetical protein